MAKPLAVLGVDVQVPGGGAGLAGLSAMLGAGRVNTRSFPQNRLRDALLTGYPDDYYEGGFFENIAEFDHRQFRVPAKVADQMDPFQRWCLASSVRAVRDSGVDLADGVVGVYASCNGLQQAIYGGVQRTSGVAPELMAVLNSGIAGRISHFLDLHGPSVMIDTACSSSLYALTMAAEELSTGRVDTAIVTSANLYLDPGRRGTSAVDVVSPTSQTRAFDSTADGTSMGEGVVTFVLKRVGDCPKERVYAQVESWAVTQDGRTATMASPNPDAQVRVLDEAWSRPEVDPAELGLLVSHGTGTSVGDSIEVEALCSARPFAELARASVPLISAKSQLGHLDAASGLLSVAVAVGALSTQQVPPHPTFVAPPDSSDLVGSAFFIPGDPGTRPTGSLAAISSFGMTGTNVHVVVRGGMRAPGDNADIGEEPRRHWFTPVRNTFERDDTVRIEALGVASAGHTISPDRDWEISEHRVGGTPMMVGTAVHEVLSGLLTMGGSSLSERDVVDLRMAGPLVSAEASVELVAAVDQSTGDGEIRYRNVGASWQPWVTFKSRPTEWSEPLTAAAPGFDGLIDIPVRTQVGDEKRVEVSPRWSVTRRLAQAPDRSRVVLQLEVPSRFVPEADIYRFWPPLLDAALNGANALLEPDEVLLPWVTERVRYHAAALEGRRFVAHIVHRGTVRDARGNVIVTVDADLWNESGCCVLSVRGHRVKNRSVDVERHSVRDLVFEREVPTTPTSVPPVTTVVLPTSTQSEAWQDGGHRVLRVSTMTQAEDQFGEHVALILADDGSALSGQCHALGSALMQIHNGAGTTTVTVVAPGAFSSGPACRPRMLAMAQTAYSLRTEFGFDVRVLDAPGAPSTLRFAEAVAGDGLFRVDTDSHPRVRMGMLTETTLATRAWSADHAGTVLVTGASSGIGRSYATWLAAKYPNLRVVGCGRREVEPDCMSFEYQQADVTDARQVARLASAVGRVDLIVHFAGVPAKGLFLATDEGDFMECMTPKVQGAHQVAEAFPECDNVVLIGSVAGYVGAMGQAEYAAANAYAIGLAHSAGPFRCLSLTGWSEIGMSADLVDELFVKTSPEEGLRMVHAFVMSDRPTAALLETLPGAARYSSVLRGAESPLEDSPASIRAISTEPTSALVNSTDAKRLEQQVLAAWTRVLGEDDYATDTTFFEYGGDSISVVQLCDELGNEFPDVFDVTTLFSCSTVKDQVRWVQDAMQTSGCGTSAAADIHAIRHLLDSNGGSC